MKKLAKYIYTNSVGWTLVICFGLVALTAVVASTKISQPVSYKITNQVKVAGTQTVTEPTTRLIAVGDIMLSRDVEQKMVRLNDWLYPFRGTYKITTLGDMVFGNLESPLIEGPAVATEGIVFRADPKTVAGLAYGGFNILSLANNHIANQGPDGIERTIHVLDEAGIAHMGAGLDLAQAQQPAILEKNGLKFGFLAYTYNQSSGKSTAISSLNTDQLVADLRNLGTKADGMIVSLHAGTEYAEKPSQQQINFTHLAIDNGAALVIGHHPHVVQPVEKYKDGYILYSLGNFIFDQMWSEETREGGIADITFTGNRITSLNIIPVKIFDFSQPQLMDQEAGSKVITRMGFTF